jgi:hypothetical protein
LEKQKLGKQVNEKQKLRKQKAESKNRGFEVLTFALGFVDHRGQDGHKFIGFVFQ